MFTVQYFTLTDSTTRYANLSGVPVDSASVTLDIIGGTAQFLGTGEDFAVDGTVAHWDSPTFGLYNLLDSSGDRFRIIYDRS